MRQRHLAQLGGIAGFSRPVRKGRPHAVDRVAAAFQVSLHRATMQGNTGRALEDQLTGRAPRGPSRASAAAVSGTLCAMPSFMCSAGRDQIAPSAEISDHVANRLRQAGGAGALQLTILAAARTSETRGKARAV
jgi:hypothetical protein